MSEFTSCVVGALAAFFAWWTMYGLECVLNGAMGGFFMPFRQLLIDLSYNLPGGRARCCRDHGDEYGPVIHARWPGWFYMVVMHFAVPLIVFVGTREVARFAMKAAIAAAKGGIRE
jgi:hypothetical protein